MKMFVGVGFLLALLVGQGLSFQCYDCRATILDPDASEEAETCYAPNLDKHLVNCLLDDQVHCSTSVEKWEESGIPFVTIKRQCSATYAEKTCSTSDSGHETCLYYCSKDGCNNHNGDDNDNTDNNNNTNENGTTNGNDNTDSNGTTNSNGNTDNNGNTNDYGNTDNGNVGNNGNTDTNGDDSNTDNDGNDGNNVTTTSVNIADGGRSDNGGGNSDNSGSLVQASLITPMLAIVGALALIFCSVIRNI